MKNLEHCEMHEVLIIFKDTDGIQLQHSETIC